MFDELDSQNAELVSPMTAILLKALGAVDILDEYYEHRSSDYGPREKTFKSIDELRTYASFVGFEILEHIPYLSKELFSLAMFVQDMDQLVGLGPTSHSSIKLPSSLSWVETIHTSPCPPPYR